MRVNQVLSHRLDDNGNLIPELHSIEFSLDGIRTVCEVFPPRTRFGQPHPAEVNWSAIGSQPFAVAETMAEILLLASRVAEMLSSPTDLDWLEELAAREGLCLACGGRNECGCPPDTDEEPSEPDDKFALDPGSPRAIEKAAKSFIARYGSLATKMTEEKYDRARSDYRREFWEEVGNEIRRIWYG